MKKRKLQKPLYRQATVSEDKLIAACDIETVGLGGAFIEGCIVVQDRPGRYFHFQRIATMLAWIADHPEYEYYFHNGSGYDFSYFIPSIYRLMEFHKATVQLVRQGQTRVIGMKVCFKNYGKGKCVIIKDSLPLLNMSLAKAAEFFAPEFPKLDIGLKDGETYDKRNPVHRDYLHRDCDALLHCLLGFQRLIRDTFGVSCGWTAGSTAIRAWKAAIPEGHCYYRNRQDIELFARQAYYGGYVYPGPDVFPHTRITSIDVNAMYAHAMRKGVPVGTPSGVVDFDPDLPGVYRCRITVGRDIRYPCIPSRDSAGFIRWATGTYETTITSEEITWGRARGYQIEVIDGYVWPRIEYPFNDFLAHCEELELRLGGALKQMAKLLRNALYGKFGSRLTSDSVEIRMDVPEDAGYRPVIDTDTGELVTGLVEHEEENESDYVMPIWAAWITMQARLYLFSLMEAVGVEHVRYCDTDSVKADADAVAAMLQRGVVRVASGYGNVKIDEEYAWYQVLGPKNYRGVLINGGYVGKVKGIPKRALSREAHAQAAEGERPVVEFDSITGILARIKNPRMPIRVIRTRVIGCMDKSKSWNKLSNGSVRPIHIDEGDNGKSCKKPNQRYGAQAGRARSGNVRRRVAGAPDSNAGSASGQIFAGIAS